MSLELFLESCLLALIVATTVESGLYELILNEILPTLDWGVKKWLYCATCVGFWVGSLIFGIGYGVTDLNALKAAFVVAGVGHTIQLIWHRIEGGTHES